MGRVENKGAKRVGLNDPAVVRSNFGKLFRRELTSGEEVRIIFGSGVGSNNGMISSVGLSEKGKGVDSEGGIKRNIALQIENKTSEMGQWPTEIEWLQENKDQVIINTLPVDEGVKVDIFKAVQEEISGRAAEARV